MVIVNACLGGLSGAVAQGQAQLGLTWVTNDGENQQCTFQITGTVETSVESDANGSASILLPIGTYTVTPIHTGEYIGDDAKSITLSSRQKAQLTWLTGARELQTVIFNSPGALSTSSTSYVLKLGESTVASGGTWNATMSFQLYTGSYTLELSAYGDSVSVDFTVPKTGGLTVDLADKFCRLTVSSTYNVKDVTIRGYVANDTSGYLASQSTYMLRSSTTAVIGGTVNTPTPPSYAGLSTKSAYSWVIGSMSITPNAGTKSVTLTCTKKDFLLILTKSGTLTVPAGTYKVGVIGGGGGGRTASRGGSGGMYSEADVTISNPTNVTVTIGAGGAGLINNGDSELSAGGSSSFGTYVSAAGAAVVNISANTKSEGGSGGGAGADGYYKYGTAAKLYGGGGAGAEVSLVSGTIKGGTAGTKGGAGGNCQGYDTSKGSAGSAGVSLATSTFYPDAGDYSGGSFAGVNYSGGGGGGGYGAKGGKGGKGGKTGAGNICGGGGGGGGGINGGNGGDGGGIDTTYIGSGGLGYGAGGGSGYYIDGAKRVFCGGGGGGGWGNVKLASNGLAPDSSNYRRGGAGAPGAVFVMMVI